MRFTVVSYGSEGDTRPISAVCRGLMQRGHEVYLFCEQSSIEVAREHGIPCEALPGDIKSTLPLENPSVELTAKDMMRVSRAGLGVVNGNMTLWMKRVAEQAGAADAILFSGLTLLLGPAVARGLGKLAIALQLQPLSSPTRAFPSALLPPLSMPGWLNLLSYRLSTAVVRRFYGKSTEIARQAVFGMARNVETNHRGAVLYGMSRHLVPRPADWPLTHEVCGPWPLGFAAWEPPNELSKFLAAGPAPLYLGFGAVSSFIRQKKLGEIVAAVAGRRAVFYPGWSQIDASMLPANFFVTGHSDHAWLFPRMSMVIHHGGAGTTHAAAMAGVPSIPVPFGVDQFFWAHRLAQAGVAPKYVSSAKLDARGLARMIEFAETTGAKERAELLGRAISAESGIRYAVERIESHAQRK